MSIRRVCAGGALAAFCVPFAVEAQERSLSVYGTFSTGYYSTTNQGEANQSLSFVPLSAHFDIDGFLVSPDLFTFSAQPELTYGPQASEAGFQGGNGIRLSLTFLRNSISPVTFRYSNVQVQDVYFASLTQVSGYSVQNRNKDLGVTWEVKIPHLPTATIDWGTGSVNSRSDIADISDYQSRGHHINVDTHYDLKGWEIEGFVHDQHQASDLLAPLGVGTNRGSLIQTVLQYQGSVRRGFLGDSELFVDGGSQTTSSLLFTLPIDLTTHYVNGNLRLRQKHRWKGSARVAYSSNLASQLLAQATESLVAPGSFVPEGAVLLPYSRGISSLDAYGTTSVDLPRGFGVFGSVERNTVLAASQDSPINANYLTTTGGVTYAKGFGWGSLSGDYAREFGIGSVTGQAGTIQGQRYSASVRRGKPGGFQIDGAVHGSDQHVDTLQPLSNRTLAIEGSVGDRLLRDFSGRVGGGWQWSDFVNAANDFRTNSYTMQASIEHPRAQFAVSLNSSLSNSLPFFSQTFTDIGVASVVIPALQIIPSDYHALAFTLHSNPMRKLEVSGAWTRSIQHLDGFLNNDFQLLTATVIYHFRRIQMEAGFIRSNQVFAAYRNTLRERFYLRLSRRARIL